MGRTFSKITKPIKNINVENRAQKVLDKRAVKPTPAPRYPSTSGILDKFADEHPEYLSAQKVKHDQLVANMRKLQLNTVGPPPEIRAKAKTLPESRDKVEDPEYGFVEPETIPPGKTTVRLAMKFLSEHQVAPDDYTAAHISREYKLDEARVQQVLKHFQTFQMHLPQAMLDKHPKLMDSLGKREPLRVRGAGDTTMIKGSSDVEGSKT